MARKRVLEPDIWSDEGFIELSHKGRLMFIGLITQADDEGRGTGSARSIKAKIFPADEIQIDEIIQLKNEISKHVSVHFYTVDEQEYYELGRWNDHQSIDRKGKSHIPTYIPPKKEAPEEPKQPPREPSKDPEFLEMMARIKAVQEGKTIRSEHDLDAKSGLGSKVSNSVRGRAQKEGASVVSQG